MKRIFAILLAAVFVLSLAACGKDGDSGKKEDAIDSVALENILSVLKEDSGLEFGPFYNSENVDKEGVAGALGYWDFNGSFDKAVWFGPQIGSMAFSMVLFRLPEGADADAFAADIKNGADPVKWICVSAEKVETAIRGNTLLFIMAKESEVTAMVNAFNSFDPSKHDFSTTESPKSALDNSTMVDIYVKLSQTCSFIEAAFEYNIDSEAPYGISGLDASMLDDYYIAASAERDGGRQLSAFFRTAEGTSAQSFAATLSEKLKMEEIAQDAVPMLFIEGNVVILTVSVNDADAVAIADALSADYGIEVYNPVG